MAAEEGCWEGLLRKAASSLRNLRRPSKPFPASRATPHWPYWKGCQSIQVHPGPTPPKDLLWHGQISWPCRQQMCLISMDSNPVPAGSNWFDSSPCRQRKPIEVTSGSLWAHDQVQLSRWAIFFLEAIKEACMENQCLWHMWNHTWHGGKAWLCFKETTSAQEITRISSLFDIDFKQKTLREQVLLAFEKTSLGLFVSFFFSRCQIVNWWLQEFSQ